MELVTNIIKGSDAHRLLLLAHGFGADERDLGGLLPHLDPQGRFVTVLPRAPHTLPGMAGYQWYDMMSDRGVESAQEDFTRALDLVDDLLDAACLDHGLDRSEAIVGGFSQGAGLALALALRTSTRAHPAGVLAMSPFIPDPAFIEVDDDAGPKVAALVQHGTHDPLVPVASSRALTEKLRTAGVPTVYGEYPMQHQVALEGIQAANAWIDQVVAGELPDEEPAALPQELVPSITTAQWQADVISSEIPVIVDFWAPWCGPCRQVSPIVEQIAAMRDGSYKVFKVNIDEEPKLAQQFDVQSIPMIGMFRDGNLVARSLGAKPRQQIEAELGMLVIP